MEIQRLNPYMITGPPLLLRLGLEQSPVVALWGETNVYGEMFYNKGASRVNLDPKRFSKA